VSKTGPVVGFPKHQPCGVSADGGFGDQRHEAAHGHEVQQIFAGDIVQHNIEGAAGIAQAGRLIYRLRWVRGRLA